MPLRAKFTPKSPKMPRMLFFYPPIKSFLPNLPPRNQVNTANLLPTRKGSWRL